MKGGVLLRKEQILNAVACQLSGMVRRKAIDERIESRCPVLRARIWWPLGKKPAVVGASLVVHRRQIHARSAGKAGSWQSEATDWAAEP